VTLDPRSPFVEHLAERDAYEDDPEGRALAAATEAEDRRLAYEDWLDRELCDSRWPWAELFRAQAADIGEVHYP
jgi:hypothetical protein